MFDMLKQMKEMKLKITEFKDSVENATFFGQDSNNIARVKISGKGILLDIDIAKDLRDQEGLEKMVLEAYNNAKIEADKFYNTEISKITGGMSLPFDMKSFL